jgi:hypothetical protein
MQMMRRRLPQFVDESARPSASRDDALHAVPYARTVILLKLEK